MLYWAEMSVEISIAAIPSSNVAFFIFLFYFIVFLFISFARAKETESKKTRRLHFLR